MNDRQQLVDRMREVRQEQTITMGSAQEEDIVHHAQRARRYYQALIAEGFSENEAFQLTMTGSF